jgi:hypothetical protein
VQALQPPRLAPQRLHLMQPPCQQQLTQTASPSKWNELKTQPKRRNQPSKLPRLRLQNRRSVFIGAAVFLSQSPASSGDGFLRGLQICQPLGGWHDL